MHAVIMIEWEILKMTMDPLKTVLSSSPFLCLKLE